MLYEFRTYTAHPGRFERLRSRFERDTLRIFARHGIEVMGVFTADGADGQLFYVTRFADDEARKRAWEAFQGDPEWKSIKAATETDGPLLAQQQVTILRPVVSSLPLG